jgi:hypothetical protein
MLLVMLSDGAPHAPGFERGCWGELSTTSKPRWTKTCLFNST